MQQTRRIEFIFEIIRVVVCLIIAFGLTLVCIALISDDPVEALKAFALGPFTTKRRFGQLVKKFIPYLLTGSGMCFVYASNRFNLCGEGAYLLSGCLVAWTGITLSNNTNISHIPMVIILLLVGAATGTVVGLGPALMREKMGINEVVTATMLNYALLYFSNWLVKEFMLDTSLTYTASGKFTSKMKLTEIVENTDIHTGLFIGIAVVIFTSLVFYRTRLGCDIRVCGANPNFARMSGTDMTRSLIIAQILGAMFCGLGGAVDMMGVYDRYIWVALTNMGTDGLLVAVLSKKNPVFVPLGAFLLAYMRTGASILNYSTTIPIEFVEVMQSILILLIAASEFLGGLRRKIIFENARKKEMGV